MTGNSKFRMPRKRGQPLFQGFLAFVNPLQRNEI